MPGATTSGADAGAGAARSREHNQGNQDRKYTVEQKAAVLRIRRCKATAFYEILDAQTTCTESEIKKAYRKQSLLTHPDKNGHEHADEAFKMVSRAFGVLGDKEKREKFDRYGTDPDSRFGAGGGGPAAQNPFSGFARRAASGGGGGGGGGGWEEEISPEEMFQRFFGGGGFGGPFGGGFDTGPQFVFNFGGGPGVRVHQFGGARPRGRPRDGEQGEQQGSLLSTIMGLLPILLLFVFPLLSSIFSGDSGPPMPTVSLDKAQGIYTYQRTTKNNVKYYMDPAEFTEKYHNQPAKQHQLDQHAEVLLVRQLTTQCEGEMRYRQALREDAQGWFFPDTEKMAVADRYEMKACQRLDKLRSRF